MCSIFHVKGPHTCSNCNPVWTSELVSLKMAEFHSTNAAKLGHAVFSKEYAAEMDNKDELASFRNEFIFPSPPEGSSREKVIYFVGNSLGLQPKKLSAAIQGQLTKWGEQAVEGHFEQPTPWLTIDDIVVDSCATLVGGKPSECVVMNTLTANLHFMMSSFYTPTKDRFKIITEKKAFPSDTYAVQSQILHHGFDPATALIEIGPREGEHLLRIEDLIEVSARCCNLQCVIVRRLFVNTVTPPL